MRFGWLVFGVLGCPDYAQLCRDGDPSVKPSACWEAGRSTGYQDGYYEAYNSAYEAGISECEASYE
jgi:hypothetical protein